ncbi:transketolase family protein [Hippea maritima]|uniref:1-deoxy-D-xylulose-5-phosphate synthase n=1 Tax=Hippea maritima (strain ATCC 700847 / DSM 10411 / MH2) TaxID=760142 RepID=F2LWE9_HIPMA|nr:transketolase family protein [Hippea maritima]AEA32995.1 1-deoxy-D-xylulose-5-phosphate synthase [Hippea maritima DSM 10411]
MEFKATREAYGKALVEIGKIDDKVVALDADLSGSTKSAEFRKQFPDRFFNLGIAEANMAGVAAGLALSGLKPYASSFAVFITGRAFEIIRQSICYQNLHVVLCGSHSGISVGEDGGSHQSVADIALMRSLPNMKVIVPADYNETYQAILSSLNMDGPVYIRTSRAKSPVFMQDEPFEVGRSKVVKEGKSATLFACGMMVYLALEAAELLKGGGVELEVVNVSSIKPLDRETIYNSAKKTGRVFSLEEHSIIGGLGSAIAEFLTEELPIFVHKIGLEDVFGESGSKDDLFCKYGFTKEAIAERIKEKLNG